MHDFPGSRWWKFDFHTHTPVGSDDYRGEKCTTATEWLQAYRNAGLDCVVVTDHNSGQWVDELNSALTTLRASDPAWDAFFVIPGVEITCSGGVHVLALLDIGKTANDVAALVGACGYHGTLGSSDAVTDQSVSIVVGTIHSKGGLAIAAHVDKDKGLFCAVKDATTLKDVLDKIDALQVVSPAELPTLVSDKSCLLKIQSLAQVQGSDNHDAKKLVSGSFTWVKLTTPSLQGLKLALAEPALSIRRSDVYPNEPQEQPRQWIGQLTMSGLDKRRPSLTIRFNPWLNTVIGGRGSGKSTVVECLRWVLGRASEAADMLDSEHEVSKSVARFKEKMIRSDTRLEAGVWGAKDALGLEGYVLAGKSTTPIIERLSAADAWEPTGIDGKAVVSQFPVRLFSQKQIHALATRPNGLLAYFDEPGKADQAVWKKEFEQRKEAFLQLRKQRRQLQMALDQRASNAANLKQINEQLSAYTAQGVAAKLQQLQTLRAEARAMEDFESGIRHAVAQQAQAVHSPAFAEWNVALPQQASAAARAAQAAWHVQRDALQTEFNKMQAAAQAMQALAQGLTQDAAFVTWQQANAQAIASLTQELNAFKAQSGGGLQQIGDLQHKKDVYESLERSYQTKAAELEAIQAQCAAAFAELQKCRQSLTQRRQAFVDKVIQTSNNNTLLKITFHACQNAAADREEGILRGFLGIAGTTHKDFVWNKDQESGLLPYLQKNPHDLPVFKERLQAWVDDKTAAFSLGDVSFNGHVSNALARLTDEQLDAVWTWFPLDTVQIEFRPTAQDTTWQDIAEGSAGQKTAALLSFILSEGNEPLILDQPEDDLDNALVYDLVVQQLRTHKARRQVIVVTHNANIVVNADAELVIPMAFKSGQIHADTANGLQEMTIRKTICDVMEGGKVAFDQRYKRVRKDMDK